MTVFGHKNEHKSAPDSPSAAGAYSSALADCLKFLHSCSAGMAIYLLSSICPDEFNLVLELGRLDLSGAHGRRARSTKLFSAASSEKQLLSRLQAQMGRLPEPDQGRFWLELARGWLLTCPFDPAHFEQAAMDEDAFCRRLRSELMERILNIT